MMQNDSKRMINLFINDLDTQLLELYSDQISPARALQELYPHIFRLMFKEFCNEALNYNHLGE